EGGLVVVALRSGAWQKMRTNQGQKFVIAGYTPSPKNFDALVIGYYDGEKLMYAARTRNGFTPASRAVSFKKMKPLEITECPFANPIVESVKPEKLRRKNSDNRFTAGFSRFAHRTAF